MPAYGARRAGEIQVAEGAMSCNEAFQRWVDAKMAELQAMPMPLTEAAISKVWVVNDAPGDYTTIQTAEPDILLGLSAIAAGRSEYVSTKAAEDEISDDLRRDLFVNRGPWLINTGDVHDEEGLVPLRKREPQPREAKAFPLAALRDGPGEAPLIEWPEGRK